LPALHDLISRGLLSTDLQLYYGNGGNSFEHHHEFSPAFGVVFAFTGRIQDIEGILFNNWKTLRMAASGNAGTVLA
jgi:hypothetical protein